MKTLISLLLLISVVVSGIASYHLFRQSNYNISSVLIITSYLSIVFSIYALSMHSRKAAIAKAK
ncbi:MAG TPA: hypothetical protein VIM64_08375 [Puia sp.]